MNKSELVAKVAEKTGMNKIAAKEAVDAVFESLKDGLKKENDKFTQLGFGTFKVEKRKARTAKNPRTGEAITITAKKVVKFKPSKTIIK